MNVKNMAKKASTLMGTLLAATALSGCAKDRYAEPQTPRDGIVEAFPKSPFDGSKSIAVTETISPAQVFAGRQKLEQEAFIHEMKALENETKGYFHDCLADYERVTRVPALPTDEQSELEASCQRKSTAFALEKGAEIMRTHGRNMHLLEREQLMEARQDVLFDDNRQMRQDNHELSMEERRAAIEERKLTAQERLLILEENLQRRREMEIRQNNYMDSINTMRTDYLRQFQIVAQPQPSVVVVQPGAASCPLPATAAPARSPGQPGATKNFQGAGKKDAATPKTDAPAAGPMPAPCTEPKAAAPKP